MRPAPFVEDLSAVPVLEAAWLLAVVAAPVATDPDACVGPEEAEGALTEAVLDP